GRAARSVGSCGGRSVRTAPVAARRAPNDPRAAAHPGHPPRHPLALPTAVSRLLRDARRGPRARPPVRSVRDRAQPCLDARLGLHLVLPALAGALSRRPHLLGSSAARHLDALQRCGARARGTSRSRGDPSRVCRARRRRAADRLSRRADLPHRAATIRAARHRAHRGGGAGADRTRRNPRRVRGVPALAAPAAARARDGGVRPPAATAAPRRRPPRAAGTGRRPDGAHHGAARWPRARDRAMVASRDTKALLATLPAACYANPAWRGLAYPVRDRAMFAGVTTLLLVVDRPVLLPVLWLAGGLTIGALFVVGHDAAHGALFRSRRLAYWTAQLALLPSLHAYEVWVLG